MLAERGRQQRDPTVPTSLGTLPLQRLTCAGGEARKPSSSIWEAKNISRDFCSPGVDKELVVNCQDGRGPDAYPRLSLRTLRRLKE